jgi:hypothetical protein
VRLRRPIPPVSPPVVADDERRVHLAAAILFTAEPSDRALAGWHPGVVWLALELEELGVLNVEAGVV